MTTTPKAEFIEKVLKIVCKHCSRKIRIQKRLETELPDNSSDFAMQTIADRIVKEETTDRVT